MKAKLYNCPYCGKPFPHKLIYAHTQFQCAKRPKR